jgi:hypothetical protein
VWRFFQQEPYHVLVVRIVSERTSDVFDGANVLGDFSKKESWINGLEHSPLSETLGPAINLPRPARIFAIQRNEMFTIEKVKEKIVRYWSEIMDKKLWQ